MNKDGIYYNLKKDSISFSKESQALMQSFSPDTLYRKMYAETFRQIALSTEFRFAQDGKFRFTLDLTLFAVEGMYQKLSSQNIIKFTNKKSVGLNDFDLADKIKYLILDGLLHISIDGEDEEYEFVFERKEK
jgi:hypothetical protein